MEVRSVWELNLDISVEMALKFGTDGVRGRAFVDLTPEWVAKLAISASDVLQSDTVVIGTDVEKAVRTLSMLYAPGSNLEDFQSGTWG